MSPVDGATKQEDGLEWVYRNPPGTWVIAPIVGPLSWRSPDEYAVEPTLEPDDASEATGELHGAESDEERGAPGGEH